MALSEKLDLYKVHKAEYVKRRKPQFVQTSRAKYLSITGKGEPGGEEFAAKVGAMYGMAFTVKMNSKRAGRDYKVCHLEGLWWGSTGDPDFSNEPPGDWKWKLLIRTPDFITESDRADAVASLLKKGKDPSVQDVKLETIDEGSCVQMLHVGPFSTEDETVATMKAFAEQNGKSFRGLHHEIYLSDPRRVPEERLRTIIRMPVG